MARKVLEIEQDRDDDEDVEFQGETVDNEDIQMLLKVF